MYKYLINGLKKNNVKLLIVFAVFLLSLHTVLAEDVNSYCMDNSTLATNMTISGDLIPITKYCAFGCNEIQHRCNDNPYLIKSTTLFDVMAIIFFLGNLIVMFAKIYNITKLSKGYDRIFIFVTMIFSFLSWLIMIVYLSLNPGLDIIFWMQITTFVMLINFFMMVLEIIILWASSVVAKKPKTRERLLRY